MPGGNEWGICDGFRRRRRLYKDMPAFVIAVGNPARFVCHACRCCRHLSESLMRSCGLRYGRIADNG